MYLFSKVQLISKGLVGILNSSKNELRTFFGAARTHLVRCAVALVRAKAILKSVQDVHACGSFSGERCAIALLQQNI